MAALMAAQPKSSPGATQRHRNAQLLSDLLHQKEHLLRRQATRHADGPDDVDDALQSAYTLFLERFRGDCEPLAWLYTTVKREAWAIRRRASRTRERGFSQLAASQADADVSEAAPGNSPSPDECIIRKELLAERHQALAGLKPDQRQALWLLGLGLSYAEICEITGWTHTKVNRCVSEGRSALRQVGALP